MSIIDDIYSVESLVENIKSSGRKEIQEIYNAATKKEKELQEYFEVTYVKESQEMEAEMLERISEYEAYLKNKNQDPALKLETSFQNKKKEIENILIDNFWKS
ncbi:MAG: hypothetical protein ACRC9L_05670 [Brevinema sp.]